ncbi:MAG: L,D-transpeptidase [Variovorax sp.]|nr:L,D-transpeptidase [Variovorax sp.]
MWGLTLAGALCLLLAVPPRTLAAALASPRELAAIYRREVDRALAVPEGEVRRYQALAEGALRGADADLSSAQYLLVVDRDPKVQAALLFWRSAFGEYRFIGASPVSTGRPGTFDHFETPAGVFEHSPSNPDFRAEGTFNSNGIRGYGRKGMRVYDFGWQRVPKGWGDRATIDMRLQMHATDPDALEGRLGSARSKGCVRIPATLNTLLDHYGVLDAGYELLAADGTPPWVLKNDRETVADPGRYMVIVDSALPRRAPWTVAPNVPRERGHGG